MFQRKRPEEPQCPECGRTVDPTCAVPYRPKPRAERREFDSALIGIYCSSDCLLDAFIRRFPFWRTQGQGT